MAEKAFQNFAGESGVSMNDENPLKLFIDGVTESQFLAGSRALRLRIAEHPYPSATGHPAHGRVADEKSLILAIVVDNEDFTLDVRQNRSRQSLENPLDGMLVIGGQNKNQIIQATDLSEAESNHFQSQAMRVSHVARPSPFSHSIHRPAPATFKKGSPEHQWL